MIGPIRLRLTKLYVDRPVIGKRPESFEQHDEQAFYALVDALDTAEIYISKEEDRQKGKPEPFILSDISILLENGTIMDFEAIKKAAKIPSD